MRQGKFDPFDVPETRSLPACSQLGTHAANDNAPGAITPDDAPFFLALALIFAAIVVLATYVVMSGPDDVMVVLRR